MAKIKDIKTKVTPTTDKSNSYLSPMKAKQRPITPVPQINVPKLRNPLHIDLILLFLHIANIKKALPALRHINNFNPAIIPAHQYPFVCPINV
jgi:hypothetical protein